MNDLDGDSLEKALSRHQIELPADQIERLQQYCGLLWSWNEKLNLTRHIDFERFVTRDVVDSLQLAALLHPHEEVLDVGTGGGVPGIILAIVRPDLQMSLCESVGKKARAVDNIVQELELRVPFFQGRAEDILEDFRFDAIVARAVGSLWKMLKWFEPHWLSVGRLLAVKGPKWVEERNEARERGYLKKLQLRRAVSYPVVGADFESVILKIWPEGVEEK